eukprot:Platyproteum_vivax@DN14109_c0_g1_i1.p1
MRFLVLFLVFFWLSKAHIIDESEEAEERVPHKKAPPSKPYRKLDVEYMVHDGKDGTWKTMGRVVVGEYSSKLHRNKEFVAGVKQLLQQLRKNVASGYFFLRVADTPIMSSIPISQLLAYDDGVLETVDVTVDSKERPSSISLRLTPQEGRGLFQDASVWVLVVNNAPMPYFEKPKVDEEGKVVAAPPQQGFLSKYWWMIAIAAAVVMVSANGGSEQTEGGDASSSGQRSSGRPKAAPARN